MISKYNHEGYHDPTAYGALSSIEAAERKARFRPVVYVCSPYSGDVEANVESARRYCRFAVDSGYIPLAPHLLFPQFMCDEDGKERELALFMNMVLLAKCAELWVFGSTISKGMAQEILRAERRGMPIRHFTTDCEEAKK